MKYSERIINLIILLLLSSCNFASNFSTTIPTSTPTTLETTSKIYSAALSYGTATSMSAGSSPVQYCSGNDPALYYITKNPIIDKEDWERIHQQMPAIEKDLWDNFLQINLQAISLPKNLDIDCKYRLITDDDMISTSSFENYLDFYSLSRIALNSNQDHALVYRGYEDYDFCYSDLLYLEILDGQWKVVDAELLVIC